MKGPAVSNCCWVTWMRKNLACLQVSRLQETLREEHQKYRDECDARKLLIADINDLRYQQEDYMASKQSNTDQEVTEDPVMLKLALKYVC